MCDHTITEVDKIAVDRITHLCSTVKDATTPDLMDIFIRRMSVALSLYNRRRRLARSLARSNLDMLEIEVTRVLSGLESDRLQRIILPLDTREVKRAKTA